jgi:hypothetical protein
VVGRKPNLVEEIVDDPVGIGEGVVQQQEKARRTLPRVGGEIGLAGLGQIAARRREFPFGSK